VARQVRQTSGTVVLDKEKGTGTVDITVDTSSIGLRPPSSIAHQSAEMLTSRSTPPDLQGTLTGFKNGVPTAVDGQFTLHGVTHP